MDNPKTLSTLGTQDTGRRQATQKHKTEEIKDEQHGPHQKPGVNTYASEGLAVPSSCKL